MRARHYDPVCRRFVSQDKAKDGANWFMYCGDDPVNLVDASGKSIAPEYASAGVAFLLGMAFGFFEAMGEFIASLGVFATGQKSEISSFGLYWGTLGSMGMAAIAYIGEKIGEGSLSSKLSGKLMRALKIVGGVGFATGGLGTVVQILYGTHEGQNEAAMFVCEWDMEHG
jgi:hypothetical protein